MTDLCGLWSEEVKVEDGLTYPLSITHRLEISSDRSFRFDSDFVCGIDPVLYSYRIIRKGSWTKADMIFTLDDSSVTADEISLGDSFPVEDEEAMRRSILADWPVKKTTYEIIELNETEFSIRTEGGDPAEHRFTRS